MICCHMTAPKRVVMWLGGIQHNAEWRGRDDLASYVLQLQDSEKVSNNFINS